MERKSNIRTTSYILAGCIILVLGLSTTMWVVRNTDTAERESLMRQAETIANSIHADTIDHLTGTEADLHSEVYREMKTGMVNLHKINPDTHFIYLMGYRDGELFIYMDSEPPESEDYSPPGDVYEDASLYKIQNSLSRRPFIEGPYTDEWGTWVSGYAPVIDQDRNLWLAEVGIDMHVEVLRNKVIHASLLPAFSTIFFLILLIVYYYSRKRQFDYIHKLQEVDKMKTEFVSVASHQLRTPLTGIKWFSELLLRGKAGEINEKAKDFLKDIHNSNERMIKLVEDLLNVSRIDMGKKFEIVKKSSDLVKIIDSLSVDLVGLSNKHKVKIKKSENFPKELVLGVDEEKIRQVFGNLLSNAMKYSKEDGIVEVGFEARDKSTIWKVKDNGLGIPKNQQSKMFQKFFRADNVQTKETDGTGLGLYIAKAIIEGHGGKIWFESPNSAEATLGKEENKGTTFFVEIPLV